MAKTILVTDFQHIYLDQIKLVLKRLEICERFLKEYNKAKELPILESAILQMRKAMECVAFAAVARKRSNNPILGKGKRSLNQAVVCSQFQGSKLS